LGGGGEVKPISEHLRDSALTNCKVNGDQQDKTLDSLRRSQWSLKFETLMRNRLIVGALRYGLLHEEGKPQYNRIQAILDRTLLYKKTNNKEFLVDIANMCLLEFEEGEGYFMSTEDTPKVKATYWEGVQFMDVCQLWNSLSKKRDLTEAESEFYNCSSSKNIDRTLELYNKVVEERLK
jgi:hypothetical protein